jgi:hypothetical protein
MEESEGDIGITKAAPELLNQIELQYEKLLRDGCESESDVLALIEVLEPFQDSPQLLDKRLAEWVEQLSEVYVKDREAEWATRVLYTLCKIRGAKVVSRFFSSRVTLLGEVVEMLVNSGERSWQTRYVLLLWLSILVLAPFSLDKFDAGFEEKLYDNAYHYLDVSGKERDGAALVMARLITRADVKDTLLERFFEDVKKNWASGGLHYRLGVVQTTAVIWRIANVSGVRQFLYRFYDLLQEQFNEDMSAKLRKFCVKNLGRISLAFSQLTVDGVPEQVEDILGTLIESLGDKDTGVRYTASKAVARIVHSLSDEDLRNEVIGALFGIFQEDVIVKKDGTESLDYVSNSKWHGTILCIAELLRRRLLPATYFEELANVLEKALQFEQRRLTFALGANVRDASCYVCWSLFRVYKEIPANVIDSIFESLVSLCSFDREVNIRRAASAAIQEGIGRQNGRAGQLSVEEGLQLIQIVDYLRIGLRSRSFLEVASDVYDLGYQGVVNSVLRKGVCSWDPDVRRLGGRSVHLLSHKSAEIRQSLIDNLISMYDPHDFEVQHGVLYALGELFWDDIQPRISDLDNVVGFLEGITDRQLKDENELLNCEAFLHVFRCLAKLSGSNFLFQEISNSGSSAKQGSDVLLFQKRSKSISPASQEGQTNESSLQQPKTLREAEPRGSGGWPPENATNETDVHSGGWLPAETKARIINLVDKLTVAMELQKPSVVENAQMVTSVLPPGILTRDVISHWITRTSNSRGVFSACFGDLDAEYVTDNGVVDALTEIIDPVSKVEPAVRMQAVESLGKLFKRGVISFDYRSAQPLLVALDDYTVDSRGDVGSWVREAAIKVCFDLYSDMDDVLQGEVDKRLLRMSVEVLNKLRLLSATSIQRPKAAVDIVASLPEDYDRSGYIYFPHMIQLVGHLSTEQLREFLLGYVVSAGAQAGSEDTLKGSLSALIDYLKDRKSVSVLRELIFLCDLKQYGPKVAICTLRVLHQLLESGVPVPDKLLWSIYVKAYNMHINTKSLVRIKPSVDIITTLASIGCSFAIKRLPVLCRHFSPEIRTKASETLYEISINEKDVDQTLLTTIGDSDFSLPINQLKPQLASIEKLASSLA